MQMIGHNRSKNQSSNDSSTETAAIGNQRDIVGGSIESDSVDFY